MNARAIAFPLLLAFGLLAAPAGFAAPAAAPAGPRAMTPEDLWAIERVGAPVVSPDGLWAVYPVTVWSVEKNKSNADLWLVPADGGAPARRLTWNEESDGSPAWSPDGQSIAFVSKRGADKDKPAQLYLLPLAGGEAEPVTDLPISPSGAKWSPDGKRLFFGASTFPDLNDDWEKVKKRLDEQKDDKVKAKPSESRWFRAWDTYVTDGSVAHLFALDLATRKVKDLTPGMDRKTQFQGGGIDWDLAPDGREIAFAANTTPPPYVKLNSDIFSLPLSATGEAAGAIRDLTAGQPADETSPRYSPDGHGLFFLRNRRPDVDPDFNHLARYDRESGRIDGLLESWDVSPSIAGFSSDGREILLEADERAHTKLYAVPLDGATAGTPKRLSGEGVIGGADVGRAGRVVFSRSSITRPGDLFSVPIGGGEEKALTAQNADRMAKLLPVATEEIDVPGAGGEPVQALVVYPPGYEKGKRYPFVQAIHGGPFGAWGDEFHFRWSGMLFASQGYVVGLVNFHGSTGYGQAFAESIIGAHGDKPFADVEAVTDAMVARGIADPERLFAAGGSYGGYLVDWILGHTKRYAALVSHAGVYDLLAQFASDSTWGRPNNYGASPWEDPQRIVRWSPSYFAKNFVTPTLVLHGEKDFRVPVTQGINLYQVLVAKGVPARIVVIPDENHWISKPQAAVLWWKEMFAWFARWDPARKAEGRPQAAKKVG